MSEPATPAAQWLPRADLGALLVALRRRGYRVVGPVVRDGAVAFDSIEAPADLPVGWRDVQTPGSVVLEKTEPAHYFGVTHGAQGVKPWVFAPRETLLQIEWSDAAGLRAEPVLPARERVAVIGARACDLAALAVQDRTFLHGRYPDPQYAERRAELLLVAVSCTRSVSTCFCTSMGTGPEARDGYDLALTELHDGFVVRHRTAAGDAIVRELGLSGASAAALGSERDALERCAAGMQHGMDTEGFPERLYDQLEHPRWDDVGARCLGCTSCTLVCPTCFCHDEHDEPALSGTHSLRVREWDSCFNRDHGQIHGLNFRPTIRDRYRQWLVHKLAGWIDQFGTSGCVGCGRCIAWCPVGIDIRDEVAALRGDAT